MRRPLIAGNWKMHKTVAETSAYLEGLIAEDLPTSVDVVCCPTAVSLPAAAMLVTGSRIGLGAQNVHWEASGAFTAELAALPRPWQKMSDRRQNSTRSQTTRK